MVAGPTHTNLIFDAVVPFGRLTDQEVEQKIRSAVALDGNYCAVVNVERSHHVEKAERRALCAAALLLRRSGWIRAEFHIT